MLALFRGVALSRVVRSHSLSRSGNRAVVVFLSLGQREHNARDARKMIMTGFLASFALGHIQGICLEESRAVGMRLRGLFAERY